MLKVKDNGKEYVFHDTRFGVERCTTDVEGNIDNCMICTEAAFPENEEKAKAMLVESRWFPAEELLDRKLFVGGLCRLDPERDDDVRVYKKEEFGRYSFNELINMGFMSDFDMERISRKRATEMMEEVGDFCANNDISYVKIFKEERDATEFAEFLHDEGFVE